MGRRQQRWSDAPIQVHYFELQNKLPLCVRIFLIDLTVNAMFSAALRTFVWPLQLLCLHRCQQRSQSQHVIVTFTLIFCWAAH
jgi:hypothetical protein